MFWNRKNSLTILVMASLASPMHAVEKSPKKFPAATQEKQPNVLIFLLDDAGFAHIGAFGGLIDTPNIDRVAKMGLRYTNFHTTALCSPSRAALLTGRNHHSVGTGVISELQTNFPGYTSRIPKDKFPLVEALRQSAYATAAFGKWHNTPVDEITPKGPFDLWPMGLGFEKFYGFMAGDASQWEPLVWNNTTPLTPHADREDYHFTADMTDQALAWLRESRMANPGKPFFMYYATGAVHAPHHAPASYIEKYKGRFDKGWDEVRAEILARQKLAGIVPPGTELAPRPNEIKAWNQMSADERRLYAHMQEVFAAYLDHTDAQFGRVLAELEASGQLDNTIIIVTSDNGASGEGGLTGSFNEGLYFNALPEDWKESLARIDEIGSKKAYNHYPAGWALAGNTPLKYFKQTTNEGGVRDPFIIAWPARIKDQGAIRSQYAHVIDVLPTVLDAAQVPLLKEVNGVEQKPVEGTSFAKTLTDAEADIQRPAQYYEMLGNRAIWQDGWKAVAFHGRLPWTVNFSDPNFADDPWNLYKIDEDPSETHDIAAKYPEKLAELRALFHQEALKYNVYPLDDSTTSRLFATYASFTAGKANFVYKRRETQIHEALSPPVKNKSHSIIANFVMPIGGAEGVLVAAGGRFGGYVLFVMGGRLHFVHNMVGEERFEVISSETFPTGTVEARMDFVKTGEFQGTAKLYINSQLVGEGQIPRTTPILYSQYDSFDIGEDSGSPVSDQYEAPFRFPGIIEKVEVRLK